MSQYIVTQIVQIAKVLLDRGGVAQQNAVLYNTILNNISNPTSDAHRLMMQTVNQQTGGRWVTGIHEQEMVNILKPFLSELLNTFDRQMRQQAQFQPQPQGYGGGYNPNPQGGFGGYAPPHAFNTTANLYDSGVTVQPQQPVQQLPIVDWQSTTSGTNLPEKELSMDSFNHDGPISISLSSADTLLHHPKEGNVVSVDNYREGAFGDMRISAIDIDLNTAENNPTDAAYKAIRYAPNEVLRGIYANVVCYKEIFHIDMKTSEFKRITAMIGAEFYGTASKRRRDWRDALSAMGTLTRAEHKTFEIALLKFLNPSIFKFLRTSTGDVIEGIEELDDLKELDNPRSKLRVTQHAGYLPQLNELVGRAFDTILNPSHLIDVDDKNFGDFVHCDQIEFWHDDRSKYDYGTYPEKADRMKFIDMMAERNTVLRIKKNIIVTNALDHRMVSNITYFRGKDSLDINKTHNIGCKLLMDLDHPKRGEIERVVCIGDSPTSKGPTQYINIGRTLDGFMVLIK